MLTFCPYWQDALKSQSIQSAPRSSHTTPLGHTSTYSGHDPETLVAGGIDAMDSFEYVNDLGVTVTFGEEMLTDGSSEVLFVEWKNSPATVGDDSSCVSFCADVTEVSEQKLNVIEKSIALEPEVDYQDFSPDTDTASTKYDFGRDL